MKELQKYHRFCTFLRAHGTPYLFLSAVCSRLSAVCCLLSGVCFLLSAVCCLLSTVCYLHLSLSAL
jgi:hypothetical protein